METISQFMTLLEHQNDPTNQGNNGRPYFLTTA